MGSAAKDSWRVYAQEVGLNTPPDPTTKGLCFMNPVSYNGAGGSTRKEEGDPSSPSKDYTNRITAELVTCSYVKFQI